MQTVQLRLPEGTSKYGIRITFCRRDRTREKKEEIVRPNIRGKVKMRRRRARKCRRYRHLKRGTKRERERERERIIGAKGGGDETA